MTSHETIPVEPDIARITNGLRDTGYEFNTAIADIIDNSIAAGASHVDVRVAVDFMNDVIVSVADDGVGMNREELIDAMRYGSKQRANLSSLGKFGLGLKTASTAFCRKLIVTSRASSAQPALSAIWDLDFIAQAKDWSLQLRQPGQAEIALLEAVADDAPGTVVIWDKIDRLLPDYKKSDGKPIKKALKRYTDSLRTHISLVYQRFLDPKDDRAQNIEIKLNDIQVEAWDPFFTAFNNEPVLENIQAIELPNGERTSFTVRAFILPRKEEFASTAEKEIAAISNERQGVYVYRENRLIHGPDWLGMFRQEPHFSLLRVELSFDHKLDDAFQVDIKKSRILLNEDLYRWLRESFLAHPRREAETRYRKGAASVAKGSTALLHTSSNNALHQKMETLRKATVTEINSETGEASVQNNSGKSVAHFRIVTDSSPGTAHIDTAESLDNRVLWEPSLINGKPGVTLNTGHPYYAKAYLPNKENSAVIQALDFMLWALAQAEVNNVSGESKDAFEEYRIDVSRNLLKLVADLPDAPESQE
jgi:hypothetical protein